MNSNNYKWIDSYVDSISLRFNFVDKDSRDKVYNRLMEYIKETKLVGISYDEKKSNTFLQSTKLISSYTTTGDISKSGYSNLYTKISHFYISISFHGLKRYNKELDDKSELVLKSIMAFINSNSMPIPTISQLDICTDIKCNIDNLVAVYVNRKSRKHYYPLGKYDEEGNTIQMYDGTYEIERFTRDEDKEKFVIKRELLEEIRKRRSNVQKRAYLYDKRKQRLEKANNDIKYDLTRFEMKLQARYFINNEVSVNALLQELKDYKVLHFADLKQKERFQNHYNKANSNKHRNKLISQVSKTATEIKTSMNNIGEFMRMIDTIKFNGKGGFSITKKEDYIYGTSRFNKNFKATT